MLDVLFYIMGPIGFVALHELMGPILCGGGTIFIHVIIAPDHK